MKIEIERETDGRFIAEIPELPGVMVYGKDEEEARRRVVVLAFHTLADQRICDERTTYDHC